MGLGLMIFFSPFGSSFLFISSRSAAAHCEAPWPHHDGARLQLQVTMGVPPAALAFQSALSLSFFPVSASKLWTGAS